MMNVLSLGAGVQSSTVLLMSCKGLLPKLDAAIFADTQWEPQEVYNWLNGVLKPQAKLAGIPIHEVTAGNIRKDWENRIGFSGRAASIPFFTEPKPKAEQEGRLSRQCTKEYKIEPIQQKLRELKIEEQRITLWYGISADEMRRMRVSKVHWIENYYPLVYGFDRPLHRHDCQQWLYLHGFPPAPRSACIGCPNHDNAEWRALQNKPDEWKQAVSFDALIRNSVDQKAYLHRSCKPLPMIDFSTPEERGQQNWLNECEGMCGV